jgi:hypothetical protein
MKVEFSKLAKPVKLRDTDAALIDTNRDADIEHEVENGQALTVRIWFHDVPGMLKIRIESFEEFTNLCEQGKTLVLHKQAANRQRVSKGLARKIK